MNKEKLQEHCSNGLSASEIAFIEKRSVNTVRRYLKKYELKTSWKRPRKTIISDEKLLEAYNASENLSDIFRYLNLNRTGGAYYHYTKRLKNLNVDMSQFNKSAGGKATAKRKNRETIKNAIRRLPRSVLKKHMDLNNIDYICSECGIKKWKGHKLLLHIHHVDQNPKNNSIENLCYQCPNCHNIQHYDDCGKRRHNHPSLV